MTNKELLTCGDPRAIDEIRVKLMKKKTMVKFLMQDLKNMSKNEIKKKEEEIKFK